MAKLSYAQVYGLARGAGLGRDAAITATAVAFAESGGNSAAVGDVNLQDATWGPSIGLWQIRSMKDDRGTGNVRDATRLKQPSFNARSMATISSNGRDFGPWSVYKSGAYRAHLAAARKAAGGSSGPWPDVPAAGGATGAATGSGGGSGGIRAPHPTRGDTQTAGWDWSPLPGDDGLPGYFDDLLGAAGDEIRGAVLQGVVLASLVALGGTLIVLGAWRAVQ
ncbi:MAG: hypothetical protein QM714_12515 [Nocardioides sp.]|uniref:hypothetical protein n=1 Tax=Nocardioides sp. TaxID=35761 RepID=UPI0039E58430